MTENEEFREKIKEVIRRHDPAPDELRAVGEGMKAQADRWEDMEETF
jgi:hypothetical protein